MTTCLVKRLMLAFLVVLAVLCLESKTQNISDTEYEDENDYDDFDGEDIYGDGEKVEEGEVRSEIEPSQSVATDFVEEGSDSQTSPPEVTILDYHVSKI